MKQKIKGYFKKLFKILAKPEMAILPSNIAFNLILAIIPILTIIVLIASAFDVSIDLVTKLIQSMMPEQVSSIIIDVISGKGFDTNIGISNILAFFLASNGTYAVITASDTLYKIDKKDKIKKRISALVILTIIIMLLLFLAIVPIFGATVAAVIGAILIGTVSIKQAIVFVIVFMIVQQIEGNIIYPKVVGKKIGLPPIITIIAVIVGGKLGGVFGMLISVPLTSILYTLFWAQIDGDKIPKLKIPKIRKNRNTKIKVTE